MTLTLFFVSLSIFLDPLFVATSPLFISIFLPLISLAGLFLQVACSQPDFLGIFTSSFPGSPPPLRFYLETRLSEGVCTIQAVLYVFNVEEIR